MTLPLDPFRRETEADTAGVQAVLARARRRRARPRAWRWPILFTGLVVGGLAWARAEITARAPVDVDGAYALERGADLHGTGTGRWEGGTFTLVSGDATVSTGAFRIVTREGAVDGEDASVRVSRDVLGTAVAVTAGVVTVTCEGAAPRSVHDEALCLPVSAEGLLARAAALPPGAEARAALDAALSRANSDAVREEALFLRALSRLEAEPAAGRADLVAACAIRAGVRHADCLRALARLNVGDGACEAAMPLLEELDALGVLGEDAALVARCSQQNSSAGDRPGAPPPSP